MATIRQLEEALLAKKSPEAARPDPWRLSPEALRWGMEKDAAPVEAKNVLLALLNEERATRWIALASLVVSIATLLILLFRG